MRNILIIILLVALSGSLTAWHAAVLPQIDGPQLKFDGGDMKDYGKTMKGVLITDTFWFENTGSQPLVIGAVTPSCGCTSVAWTKIPVPPHQKGFVSFNLNTRKEDFGKFTKELFIQSNAVNATAKHGRYELQVRGVVKRRI